MSETRSLLRGKSLVKKQTPKPTTAPKKQLYATLYPNPNSGEMTLNYKIDEVDKGELLIMDLTGRVLAQYNLVSTENTMQVSQESLNNGIYIYQVLSNGKIINSDRLVIIK